MAFRVGQKVARFAGNPAARPDIRCPSIGEPVTVANVYTHVDGEAVIEIVEYPVPANAKHPPGIYARYFRPVVSTQSGMAILEQIRRDVTNKELRPIFHDEQV